MTPGTNYKSIIKNEKIHKKRIHRPLNSLSTELILLRVMITWNIWKFKKLNFSIELKNDSFIKKQSINLKNYKGLN